MRSPAKEGRDPNRAGGSAVKKRTALGAAEGSPVKKQQRKKLSKKDRRRVSFAPDPELTSVHHFVKDDDYTSNSDGHGRVLVQYGEEEEAAGQRPQLDAQHPALVGEAGYRPGFWNKTVPENSPLSDFAAPGEGSPGMVSMELTQLTLPLQPVAAPGWGEVTAGLPSLGALAAADEAEVAQQQWQQGARVPGTGEVTAGLPSLGALAEADEWGEEVQRTEAGWAAAAGAADATTNITAALPGLGALVAEDEDGTAGMDLTLTAGRVLEHRGGRAADAPPQSPALLRVAASPAAHLRRSPRLAASRPHPALTPAQDAPPGEAEPEPTLAVSLAAAAAPSPAPPRRSGGSDELPAPGRAASAQLNKWGFAPGADDTLDINLEMHGRMIMGDQTFNGLYRDNTTGDSRHGGHSPLGGARDDTGDSLLLDGDDGGGAAEQPQLGGGDDDSTAAAAAHASAPSPAASLGSRQPSPAPGPAPAAAVAQAPNWAAPAFLPPYMQAPAASGAQSDHPALVHSPNVTGSSLNTLETRRVSVGLDARRMSVSSRRFSVQDVTGRLLADDGEEAGEAALTPGPSQGATAAAPAAAGGPRTRRRSSGAAFLGRDVTEKLLVDDSVQGEEEEPAGPLADLKRQMRILSHGSPVLAAHAEQAAAAAEQTAAEGAVHEPRAAAKTPRAAASMGYADSHNPATAGLLRTGGTTRLLLQETVQLGGQPEAEQYDDGGLDELEEGQDDEPPAAEDGSGTAVRTGGTTKLLADLTMASVVGAKLLGRQPQGTPEVGQGPGSDGLTDFSLDEFERPPELAAGQQAAQEEQQQQQAGWQEGRPEEEADCMQQDAEGYASPAMHPMGGSFGAGYPLAAKLSGGAPIPGGPKLARTPVTVRAASQPRAVQGTPHSHARSVRSQSLHGVHHSTPRTHGTHRLARTPGGMRPAAAAYPASADVTAEGLIPGGPKLARTPLGRTPATGRLLGPGSAVAQHYPGSGRGVHFAAGPGSASAGRYPGSAVQLHRGGLTPQLGPDFAKLAEVQLLDNLRRGASINYADLQPNPVPQNLAEAYRLLTIISPQVTTLESGIRILQEEVQARRVSAADAEQAVGQCNPPAFQRVQQADDEGLEAMREHVGVLKRVCRQKAVYCLKDVRRQMEESRGARLRRNLEALQADLAWAQGNRQQLEGVARAAEQYIADQHSRMAQKEAGWRAEGERRTSVLTMRRAIEGEASANEQRRQRLAEVQERVARLREQHAVLNREQEGLRGRTDALQMTLMQSSGQQAVGRESSPRAILHKLEGLDTLKACVGWQLESAREDPVGGEAALRLADLFRLRLSIGRTSATASVEVLPEEDCSVPADRRALLAALAAGPDGAAAAEVQVVEPSAAKVAALVQATTARLSRLCDLAAELDGLRLAFPALFDITCRPDGWLALAFVNLHAEVKFGVSLRLPCTYPAGPIEQRVKIWFDGEGQVTEQRIAQAVAAVADGTGRLRAICRELSLLAREAVPRPAVAQDVPFHSNWQNPLFGSWPALSAQT